MRSVRFAALTAVATRMILKSCMMGNVCYFSVQLRNDLGDDDGEKRERREAAFILEVPSLMSKSHTDEVQTCR